MEAAPVGVPLNLLPVAALDEDVDGCSGGPGPLKFSLEPVAAPRKASGQLVQGHLALDRARRIDAVDGSVMQWPPVRQCDVSTVIAVIERCPLQVITEGGKSLRRPVGDLLPGVSYDAEGLQSVLNLKSVPPLSSPDQSKGSSSSSVPLNPLFA